MVQMATSGTMPPPEVVPMPPPERSPTKRPSFRDHVDRRLFGCLPPADPRAAWALEAEKPWGVCAQVPMVEVFVNTAVVSIEWGICFAVLGWVDSLVGRSTAFLRGAVVLFVPSWSSGIYTTLCEFLDGRKASYGGMLLSVLLYTTCAIGLAAVPWELGLVVQIMTGVMLHMGLLLAILFSGRGIDVPGKDYLIAQCYWFVMFSLAFATCVNGWCTLFWWPILADEHPVLAGPALAISANFVEGIFTRAVYHMDNWLYKRVPNSRRMGSQAIMAVRSCSEALRLTTLWYSALRSPSMASKGWLSALVSSLCINVVTRLGWQQYLFWWLTCQYSFFIPSCWTFIHRDARFAFGYAPFGGPIAVIGARYVLTLVLGTTESAYFNEKVLCILVGSFAKELLEDATVAMGEFKGLLPQWHRHKTVREFTSKHNTRDPDNATVAWTVAAGGNPVQKARASERPYGSRLVALAITTATAFISYSGLICLVSVDYLLGVSSEIWGPAVDNGALLWPWPA